MSYIGANTYCQKIYVDLDVQFCYHVFLAKDTSANDVSANDVSANNSKNDVRANVVNHDVSANQPRLCFIA